MKETLLIYDPQEQQTVNNKIIPALEAFSLKLIPFDKNRASIAPESNIITYLSDEQLGELVSGIMGSKCTLAFLPHFGMKEARQGYGIADSLPQAVEDIEKAKKGIEADLLLCNGRPVFNRVVIGSSLSLMSGSVSKNSITAFFEKLTGIFKGGKALIPRPFTIITEDKPPLTTAAIGIIAVLHSKSTFLSRTLFSRSFINDGRMHGLILAPRSIMGLLRFYIKSLFQRKNNQKLPSFIGHIKARSIIINVSEPVDFSLDNTLMSAKGIELLVSEDAFMVIPGRYLNVDEHAGEPSEMYRINRLPKGEAYLQEIVGKPLSLLYHASTEEFKDLFKVLRDNSKVNSSYLTLMVLSTLLATLGLFSNSSPVIIGAMILAPLMAPIISLSMGVLRQEKKLMINSAKTIGYGLLLSYLAAIFLTLLTPLHTLNEEITARIRPNLLDLGVAIVSGIAGAYAHAREEVAKTLAGVAIAVALVPPLAVSGIGIGWGEWQVFFGAMLLFLTNLAGIVLAGAITFMLLGFSPFQLARKGLFVSLTLVALISFPLGLGFNTMVRERQIAQALTEYQVGDITIRDVTVIQGTKPMLISVKLVAQEPVTTEDLERVKQAIQSKINQEEVQLEILVSIRR
ncbi:TIGR00341 family protein [Pontibacter diazotrophicus]|uniref:TIGR00341 family protein n=1 Tax=Pontibacter diazotrophicus TaxID=1400979 RepID=A0A3D8LGA2_9BACT|nr:TIGR00341 family protein [Pontibacter diazotrophicus]RDV16427.1 TIGR00341 family protein [Pontibacter diazotrophicus]